MFPNIPQHQQGARVVKKTAKLVLHADHSVNAHYAGTAGAKDAFMVLVVGPDNFSRQLTFHHPIGYTSLEDDDWVCTSSSEVANLLIRREHPDYKRIMAAREAMKVNLAVQEGWLDIFESGNQKLVVYPGTTVGRKMVLAAANKKLKQAKAEAKSRKLKGFDARLDDYLDEEFKADEAAVNRFFKTDDVRKLVAEEYPFSDYQTCGGSANNLPQEKSWVQGGSSLRAMDNLIRGLTSASQIVSDAFDVHQPIQIPELVKASERTGQPEPREEIPGETAKGIIGTIASMVPHRGRSKTRPEGGGQEKSSSQRSKSRSKKPGKDVTLPSQPAVEEEEPDETNEV